ncbi:MAG TPA: hypothetical protein VMR21_06380 [Vicinamibacteria bacterium]|nr:hypothetical protein [Vicinamibacteria bacterium]
MIWGTRGSGRRWAVAVLLGGALGCGGGGGTGGGPATPSSPTSPSSPDAGGSGPTITITSSGVDPKEVQVAVGGRVTFVNRDNAFHEMSSDPHPLHTDCPEINVGALGPGASRQTAVFTRARTCTYHDHGQDTNTSLQGAIVVR